MASDLATTINFINYSDAYENANRYIHSEKAALKKLENAIEAGDDILAKAIRKVAEQNNWDISTTLESAAQKAHDGFQAVLTQYEALANDIDGQLGRGEITVKRADDLFTINSARADGPGQIDAIANQMAKIVASADRITAAEIGKLTATPGTAQDQLLAEMRLTKAWERVRREFDSVPAENRTGLLSSVLGKLRSATDPYEVAVILLEGPSYLSVKGVENAQDSINHTLQQIRPEIGAAAAYATAAHQLEVVIMYDARVVRDTISSRAKAIRGTGYGYADPTSADIQRQH